MMVREDGRMEQHHAVDDQSHYEISLTAGQAFVAFVLLLLSLAASFAFGLMLGKGQLDERLVAQKDVSVVTEAALAPGKRDARIIELGVAEDDFREPTPPTRRTQKADTPVISELETSDVESAVVREEPPPARVETPAVMQTAAAIPPTTTPIPSPDVVAVPHYAQLFSSADQKAAENLAARLIDGGFMTSYVERGQTEKGPVFRVRVRFPSEQEARAAEPKLREFSKEVWITRR
jgi:hypothetical protein